LLQRDLQSVDKLLQGLRSGGIPAGLLDAMKRMGGRIADRFQLPAACNDLEVVELHLQRNRSPREPFSSQCCQTLSIRGCSFDGQRVKVGEVAGKRVLGTDRLSDPVCADVSIIDALEIQ
jgi:hypothetical protein